MQKKPVQLELLTREGSGKKRVQGGESTTDVIISAFVSGNAEIFPQILQLHVPEGSKIADGHL